MPPEREALKHPRVGKITHARRTSRGGCLA